MDAFQYIDNLLYVTGFNIIPNVTLRGKIMTILLSSFAIFTVSSAGLIDIKEAVKYFDMVGVGSIVFWLWCYSYYVMILMKRGQMRKFLHTTSSFLNSKSKQELKSLAKIMSVIIILFFLFQILDYHNVSVDWIQWSWKLKRFAFGAFDDGKDRKVASVPMIFAIIIIDVPIVYLGNWVTFVLSFYVFTQRMVILSVRDQMQNLVAKYSRGVSISSNDFRLLNRLAKTCSSFDQIFSVFPFLILGRNFCTFSSFFLYQVTQPTSLGLETSIRIILMEMANLLLSFYFVLHVNRNNNRLTVICQETVLCINQNNNISVRDILLVQEIRHVSQWKPTALSMIYLDNTLIPAFAGAVLSFSVLFMQISKGP